MTASICSCHICHDVAPNLQKMYKKLRGRGLQIIAVHSTPKGYKAKDKDVVALKEWVEEAGLEFSIVDTHVSTRRPSTDWPGSKGARSCLGSRPIKL